MKKYENIVFMQGDEAEEPLNILTSMGEHDALLYLIQWHDPGNHEIGEFPAGSSDRIYEYDNYIMSYNLYIGYIGVVYIINET